MSKSRIAQVVADAKPGTISLGLRAPLLEMMNGATCEGSKFHSPTPLLVRPIYLSDLTVLLTNEGILIGEDPVYLCGVCEDNLAVYLSIRWAYDGRLPLRVKRDFGNLIHAIGDRAWEHHLKRSTSVPV